MNSKIKRLKLLSHLVLIFSMSLLIITGCTKNQVKTKNSKVKSGIHVKSVNKGKRYSRRRITAGKRGVKSRSLKLFSPVYLYTGAGILGAYLAYVLIRHFRKFKGTKQEKYS